MKKFSSINENNKQELKNELNMGLRASVHKLINDFLDIRIYGPIDPILMGTIEISGQEEFISAIVDLFSDKEIVSNLKLLQEAKFLGLDNMIDKYEYLCERQTPSEIKTHEKRINDLIKNSKGDIKECERLCNLQADKIKSGEKAFYRSLAAERLGSSKLHKMIADIFLHRSKKLGFRK